MNTRGNRRVCVAIAATVVFAGCGGAEPEDAEIGLTEVAVRVASVQQVTLRARVDAYGLVEAGPAGGDRPGGVARLASPTPAVVMAVPASEGQRIEAGTVVVMLDDRVALASLDKARHALEFAQQRSAREKVLQSVDGTSQKAIQEAAQQLASATADVAAAQGQLALVQLASPIAGIVAAIHVQPGQAVEPNTVVAEVIDLDRLVVTAHVPSLEALSVKVGQPVELMADAETAEPLGSGEVLFLSPQVDAKTATVLVRASVPAGARLRPGQFAHLRIVTEERPHRLAVPSAAIYTDHEGRSTLSVVDGVVARQRRVTIGLRDGDLIEVEGDGLVAGMIVATVGSYALPTETKVRIVGAVTTPKDPR